MGLAFSNASPLKNDKSALISSNISTRPSAPAPVSCFAFAHSLALSFLSSSKAKSSPGAMPARIFICFVRAVAQNAQSQHTSLRGRVGASQTCERHLLLAHKDSCPWTNHSMCIATDACPQKTDSTCHNTPQYIRGGYVCSSFAV